MKIELEKWFLRQLLTVFSFYTGVASIQTALVSNFSRRPGTRGPTNARKSAAPRVNRSFHGGNSANPSKYINIYI